MASFKIMKATAQGKTWKTAGKNTETGRSVTIQGGQTGTAVGKIILNSERSFDAKHDVTGMTPKKYVNKLRWDMKARLGSIVRIPDRLFKSKPK